MRKTKLKDKCISSLLALTISVAVVLVVLLSDLTLQMSEEDRLRARVLRITPLGMSMEDVIMRLKSSGELGIHYVKSEKFL